MTLGAMLAIVAVATGAAAEKPKLVVLNLEAAGDVEAELAGALSETLTAEAARRGFFQVISSREVQTLLGMERQKQLLGCSEDSSSCLSELTGALGARFVLSGTLAKLGDSFQLSLQMIDSEKAQVMGRSTRIANDLGTMQALVPWAVAEATGTPLPPPPSRVVQYSLIGAGALLLVGGGIVGQDALSEARTVQAQLDRGRPGDLLTFAEYEETKRSLEFRGYGAFGAVAVGAALVATGVLTMPADVAGPTASVALVPAGTGVAIAGTFW